MIAHDMRTPLTALGLSVHAARASASDPEAVRACLEVAERNVAALSQLVEAVVDTASGGGGKLQFRECVPRDLITNAIDQIAPTASQKRIRVESESEQDLPVFVADGNRLVRVLVNLLSNAVRFSPEGGSVRVSVKARANDGHESIVFSVSDSGPGVKREDIDRIFVSGVSIAKGGKYSSGLGLTVCKEIVEAHGGRIWVDTAVAHGAAFSFSIPLTIQPPKA
ncbi:MAG TPA: ATP-binding protein [Chthoniobacterales bacterium]